ncbi:MAG TPA: S1 RNA-binding domain-containing protein [Anaerolineae bacterium]|nr:S1 RNA-binding domain-containing protein [Anaerolineae bacterium]MCB0178869.1 S1 RNA-binding domain-containing protein [Anaerolineae bacterium]MCB0225814.1 S1 RNA-binding domain-containing protein [Anaerolineae bacterium]MCB9102676.1 S1 RNA-binding domain-containing protein [Anaerolineales bacterium]HRV95575.1 S1 RNA-binding domain-containing protein [Anaerolineae bacterium]
MSVKFTEELIDAYDYARPYRGEIRSGIVLEIDQYGAYIDVGLKHDGFVPRSDIDTLEADVIAELQPGLEVVTRVLAPSDKDGNLLLSLSQVQAEKDWQLAQDLMDQGEITRIKVHDSNRGGLLAKFKHLQAFIPASHLWQRNHRDLKEYIDEELAVKFIEVDNFSNRLIASEDKAEQEMSKQRLDALMNELIEGQVRKGVVRHLTDFGAFVDLGGADGLIHNSELSWKHVNHPGEAVQVGDEIDVYILDLDHKRKRINLSLKRLKPNPWNEVAENYKVEQLVSGKVTKVVDYGAFVRLDVGVDGLLHVSEIAEPAPDNPREFVERGERLVLRVLDIDPFRERMGLSLKRVSDEERMAFEMETS